jgi:hypothetical protein
MRAHPGACSQGPSCEVTIPKFSTLRTEEYPLRTPPVHVEELAHIPTAVGWCKLNSFFLLNPPTGASATPWCLLIHAKASLSRSVTGAREKSWCLFVHAEASLSVFVIESTQRVLQKVLTSRRHVDECKQAPG